MNNNYDIVIIGAGMAGLGAALTLSTAKQTNFIVLEAQSQPGGRIHTIPVGDSVIDLGAQWFHSVDNDLYAILEENNLIHDQTSDEGLGIYIRDDGVILDDFLVKRVDFEVGRILEECEEFVNETHKWPSSVGTFLKAKFQDFLVNCDFLDDQKQAMLDIFDWHVKFQLIDNSCSDLNHLSAKEWGRYSCLGKDGQKHINIKGGYASLVSALVKKLPKDVLIYNKPVKSIDIADNIRIQESPQCLEVFCQDGTVINTKFAIVTCSLGVLKCFNQFSMPMEEKLKEIVRKMGYGGMGKVFLQFERRWWEAEGIQLIWQRKSGISGFPEWAQHLTGFDCVLDQPNMLLAWVSHLGVEEMENTDKTLVGKQCVQLLKHFLRNDDVPNPINVYKSSWFTNRYIKGSYSHSTPSCDSNDGPPARVLCKPFTDAANIPRVFLAGEAVHESHFSTTHGAFESGQLQAMTLLRHF